MNWRLAPFSAWYFLVTLSFAAASLVVLAQGVGPVSFRVYTAQGKQFFGPLQNITPDWGVVLSGPGGATIQGKDFISLRRDQGAVPAPPLGPQVALSTGDRIPIDIAKGVQFLKNQFHVKPSAPLQPIQGNSLAIPAAVLALLWVQAPEGVSRPEPFLNQLLTQSRTLDLLLLQNGDRVEGIFLDLDEKSGCTFKVQKKTIQVPFDQIAVLAFNSLFLLPPPAQQPFGHLVLSDGGRLSLASAEFDPLSKKLDGKTLFQAKVQIPVQNILGLDVWQGRAVYLSDLKPLKYSHTPFFGVSWPMAKDASLSGLPLKAGGDFFDKGLALHSGSAVDYALDEKYEWFEALVALEETGGKGGAVRLAILVDGKAQDLGGKEDLTWKASPVALRLPIHQARHLTLQVNYASQGDVQGHVHWANARLIKN